MKRLFLPVCLLAMCATCVHAQEQEEGLLQRIDAKRRMAMAAQDVNAKGDPSLTSSLSGKSFGAAGLSTKTFSTGAYGGAKSAGIKTFSTRSFLGIKNPWFGNRIYETSANGLGTRVAREADQGYQTDSFAVKGYERADKKDLTDEGAQVASTEKPRPYLVAPKAKGVTERFTENLQKELTIDDVRELLNKSH